MRYPTDDLARTAAGMTNMGQIARILRDRPDAERSRAADAIAATLAPLVKDNWIILPARVWLFDARK